MIVPEKAERQSVDFQSDVHRWIGQLKPLMISRNCETNEPPPCSAEEQSSSSVVTVVLGYEQRFDAVKNLAQVRRDQI
ncbi:hypothetical protein BgramDRAFT_5933 [Paraburkholderia graminis C4D1M]|uniref:Uncharacterized protein n=1 Tax=Paraburkholderia graminis (strain ATCC 700544 / DSM 17151 / LMG 18924 / NCIMB 13744 / C4D1M) TaxID=396598 RepID=B1G990_PARG4|nr:hypothetical protein BgramDRAFT_5933 [Paraburkholderia graminis C4D1M]